MQNLAPPPKPTTVRHKLLNPPDIYSPTEKSSTVYKYRKNVYHNKERPQYRASSRLSPGLSPRPDDLDIVPEVYIDLKKVGEGTYAQSVFKALDSRTGLWVAVKVLKVENESHYRCVQEEVKVLEELREQSHVVSIIESHKVGDRMLVVFEYMDFDLFALMSVRVTHGMSEAEHKYIMIQILRGLDQLAEHGIMHRDVKAANILVDKAGNVKIGDLGTATHTNRTKFHSSVCTLWYRPPELLLGATNYGPEIDIWAAGCVFVELLTGCHFLRGETEQQQFQSIFDFFGTFPSDNDFYGKLPRNDWIKSLDSTKKNSQLPYYMQK